MNRSIERLKEDKEMVKAEYLNCIEELKKDFSNITIEEDLEKYIKYIKSLKRYQHIYFELVEEIKNK